VPDGFPILLLSGMAADTGQFEPQLARVPPWINPLADESLRADAARLARAVVSGCR
jgi:hypothetical protein